MEGEAEDCVPRAAILKQLGSADPREQTIVWTWTLFQVGRSDHRVAELISGGTWCEEVLSSQELEDL